MEQLLPEPWQLALGTLALALSLALLVALVVWLFRRRS